MFDYANFRGLLSCPICASTDVTVGYEAMRDIPYTDTSGIEVESRGKVLHYILCRKCGLRSAYFEDVNMAIEAWNKRSDSAAVSVDLKRETQTAYNSGYSQGVYETVAKFASVEKFAKSMCIMCGVVKNNDCSDYDNCYECVKDNYLSIMQNTDNFTKKVK